MATIVLTTLNARFIHTAFGLRYLYANMGALQTCTELIEFNINQRATDIVEKLLQQQPEIIGFGIYIWNVAEISHIVSILKTVAPQVTLILGGPEISYPPDLPEVVALADYVITGEGEISFPHLCRQLVCGERPHQKIIAGESADLAVLASPYPYYTDLDLSQRVTYVEASRGCPFKCEFCLSALDQTAKPFALDVFLENMDNLYQRGARQFKFIDRTFNLKVDNSVAILEFFLERLTDDLHLHFEVIPDHLPDRLKQVIQQYPPGSLQFEIGVQSFDPLVQQRINRRQDNQKTEQNLNWLRKNSNTHLHVDLIVGLPGDTLESFGKSFNKLVELNPQEIQVGILKRLRGAPINRQTSEFLICYDSNPPYSVLSTRDINYADMQRLKRFARFWDLIGNSGRFLETLPVIFAGQPFQRFLILSDAIYELTGSTWQISLNRLFELSYKTMTEYLDVSEDLAKQVLLNDFQRTGEKGRLDFMQTGLKNIGKRIVSNRRQLQALSGSRL